MEDLSSILFLFIVSFLFVIEDLTVVEWMKRSLFDKLIYSLEEGIKIFYITSLEKKCLFVCIQD